MKTLPTTKEMAQDLSDSAEEYASQCDWWYALPTEEETEEERKLQEEATQEKSESN